MPPGQRADLADVVLPDLPVRHVLDDVLAALAASGAAVLVAPPGTGKTTLVPLALAGAGRAGPPPGRVVVAEPRRIAARAAAARMAHLAGGPVGDLVGYAVRGDRRGGPRTVVEVVTTGVLLRRLQADPELPGVSAVVVDECHERHLDTDLVLAMLADVRAALRPDLQVLATSATAAAQLFSAALAIDGRPAPVLTATVPPFALEVVHRPPPARTRPPFGLWVDPALLDHVAAVTAEHLATRPDGDGALVIVPGAREVERVCSALRARLPGTSVRPLHGRLPAAQQDAALSPATGRRVVVATALAESSLTVPGVRLVVDAGLARRPRTDHSRGLSALVTTSASRAESDQRAGRAHREGPGTVVRCWPEAETGRRPAFPPPEVDQADLTGFVLELACWGSPDGTGLTLPSAPPAGAVAVATEVLTALGALTDGRVTPFGRRLAAVPTQPRLAAALLRTAGRVGARRAAEVVALLDDESAGGPDDLVARLRSARRERTSSWRDAVRRLESMAGDGRAPAASGQLTDDVAAALVVGSAFPDRLAARRPTGPEYLMVSGTAAAPAAGSGLAGMPWLAVAVADRAPGRASAAVRLAVATSEDVAREVAADLLVVADEVRWEHGDVVADRVERIGAVVLSRTPLRRADPEAVRAAVRDGLAAGGLGLLRWTGPAVALRHRLAFLHAAVGEPWPDVADDALRRRPDWLEPGLSRVRRRADLDRLDVLAGLRALLPWPEAARLDELAPERVEVPSGSTPRVDYAGDQPVLAVRVQEVFGWAGPAALAGGRVPVLLHLLSPAGRPAAVTADLASFWTNGYPGVRADLRGRYPKHAWPQDPTTAPPQRGVRRRG